jgi:prepilin-type N-terminal cleavage/methylation domain-containing protein
MERLKLAMRREKTMIHTKRPKCGGFTLIELLVAMALGLVIMAGIYRVFISQQDSYIVQDQVAAMQQNLRGAMYIITRDLQMASLYTNFDRSAHNMDWNDSGTSISKRALIIGRNNVTGASPIKNNTDTITIVKAGTETHVLTAGEGSSGGTINLISHDLNGDGVPDLDNSTGKNYGVIIKSDLHGADFFQVNSATGSITPPGGLTQDYTIGDIVNRADVIVYALRNPEPPTYPYTRLVRRNLGNDNGYETVAENIDNLQFRYELNDGTWVDDPNGNEQRIRAVQVFLLGRTASPQRGWRDTETYTFGAYNYTPNDAYRRKLMSTTVKTWNIGL